MTLTLRWADFALGLLRRRGLLTAIAGLGASGLLASASVAALPPGCSQSGQTVACTYTSGSNPFSVPSGVSSIHVVAVGGTGGLNPAGTDAGHGAVVISDLALPAGSTVYAVVGGNGVVGAPGAGGGGQGGTAYPCSFDNPPPGCILGTGTSGGGGGASDVRTSQTDLSSRLLVAAGGGGAGGASGGAGGSGHGSGGVGADGAGGSGGSGAGGAGGAGGTVPSPCQPHMGCVPGTAGSAGALGVGGAGGIGGAFGGCLCSILFGTGGGGGGGGWFGGGGGGGGGTGSGGGGGGGSNLVPSGGSQSIDTTVVPMVQISYKLLPTSKAQCKHGGWRDYPQFKNQGQCVAFVVKQARQTCLAERAKIGLLAFGNKYGLGRYHVLALLRCINQASR